MKALQTTFLGLVMVFATLTSCEKDRRERGCETTPEVPCFVDSNMVNIRIWNQSPYPICDMNMKYNLSDSLLLGSVRSGDSTCYIAVSSSIFSPGLKFVVGAEETFQNIGEFGTTIYSDPKTFITYYINMDAEVDSVKTKEKGETILTLYPRISPLVKTFP